MEADRLEKYSSAVTLSDMEVFVFPELIYSLVLANIMSPRIWRWRQEDCFIKLEGKSSWRKLLRMRQYIMDEYDFNLDIETWGLTTKERELARFSSFISPEDIAASNALFGYHGDRYYFDIDIRRQFGLGEYDSGMIPYWKTETVEAMDAFPRRPGYARKAGECVSLAALYAAAAFVVCGIRLEDIYMILTPLHSQNFIDIQDGVLTNNRRIVTKAMWFNGTEITYKAQRALRNEQVTVVAHNSGYVHCFYPQATIDRGAYEKFNRKLHGFLTTDLNAMTLANFLRVASKWQKHFIFCHHIHGVERWVRAETLFAYEHDSDNRIGDATFDKLFDEVSEDDFETNKPLDRVCFEHLNRLVGRSKLDMTTTEGRLIFANHLKPYIEDSESLAHEIGVFISMKPSLPEMAKEYVASYKIELEPKMSREEAIEYLRSIRAVCPTADLAFYAYRDMESCEWEPFIKAAVERNPISLEQAKNKSLGQVYERLQAMPNDSIYDGKRLAQPDEVVNYQTGDGVEKAFVMANVIRNGQPQDTSELIIEGSDVVLKAGGGRYVFRSNKGLKKTVILAGKGCRLEGGG
ncbi:MAG TPA: hypothetical protein VLH60_06870 [Sedimentisphaerales bacterium]|nr:hypothetical protein [Sedimentisphaerales bacterium]